jgi:hypothetical protein
MEKNNRELLNKPDWFEKHLNGYRSTNKRYCDMWDFFGVSLNGFYGETEETKDDKGETIYNDVTSEFYSDLLHKPIMQDYSKSMSEARDDVKYGWDDIEIRTRLKNKKKPLKAQIDVIRRTNLMIARASLKKMGNVFAHDVFGYSYVGSRSNKGKPSMLRIMIDIYIELELARDVAKKELQTLTDPLYLQRSNLKWFVQREYERYITLTTEVDLYEKEMDKWERAIALLYYPLAYCSLTDKYEKRTGYQGRKPKFLGNSKSLGDFYDTTILTQHEVPTHWDWIKAVLGKIDSIFGDVNYEYNEKVRGFVNHNFNGSTNMASNFYKGIDDGAMVVVLEGLCKLYKLSKGNLYRSSKGLCLAYKFNEEYNTDKWFKNIKIEEGKDE